MKILWVLMDYNEPFSGGVERTFHNMVRMASQHENHIWPISMSNRLTLPASSIKVNGPNGNYDLAVVEGNDRVIPYISQINPITSSIAIKTQHLSQPMILRLSRLGDFTYLGYNWPSNLIKSINKNNTFYVVPPFKDTDFWSIKNPGIPSGQLLTVGRVAEEKGLNNFIEVYNNHPIKSSSNLKIIGGSNCAPEIDKLRKTLTNSKINFNWNETFSVDSEIKSAYQLAEAVIVASPKESFGHQIIEALLCGTPVLTAFQHWCTSLHWFGKYITQCVNYKHLLDRFSAKEYINPSIFRRELVRDFGLKQNTESFNKLLHKISN